MAIALAGSVAQYDGSSAASHTIPMPAGVVSGDLLLNMYNLGDTGAGKQVTATGWTSIVGTSGNGFQNGLAYRISDGTEGADEVWSVGSGSTAMLSQLTRITGHDGADPTNSDNAASGQTASIDPFVLSASTLTGAAGTDSWIICIWGRDTQSRTITTLDSDQTLIDEYNTGSENIFSAYETGVTVNSAYSTDMSSASLWGWQLVEIKAAAAVSGPPAGSLSLMGVGI